MNDITALMATMKAAAEKASNGAWVKESGDGWEASCSANDQANGGFIIAQFEGPDAAVNREFVQAANPDNVKALVEALEARDKQIAKYHAVLNSLAFVARRYLPDYDEHPEIQAADELLESADGIQVIEGEGQ